MKNCKDCIVYDSKFSCKEACEVIDELQKEIIRLKVFENVVTNATGGKDAND